MEAEKLSQTQRKRQIKLIPKGACNIQQIAKQNYVLTILKHQNFHRFVLPSKYTYSHFVIVQDQSTSGTLYHIYSEALGCRLLTAKKQYNSIGCNFILSTEQNPIKNQYYVAKIRGNFLNTQFNIYDNGNNPDKGEKPYRKQLAFIKFNDKSYWKVQNTNIKMIIPKPIYLKTHEQEKQNGQQQLLLYEPTNMVPLHSKQNILENLAQKNSSKIQIIKSKLPDYNLQRNMYELDFKGFVDQKSKKNFILNTSLGLECLIMGKRTSKTYTILIGCPLTIIQGFGFFIACCQNRS